MNNCQIIKKNVVEFNYEDNCDTQLLIKYKPLIDYTEASLKKKKKKTTSKNNK